MLARCLKFIVIFFLCCTCSFASTSNFYDKNTLEHAFPHYAKVSNGEIEYYDVGQGTPIVLISGYGSTVSSWNWELISALAANHRVIFFDNRDTGGTVINSTSYTSQDLANDTYNLITALKLNKPVILGISMGGMIAQQYAVLHPQAMSKLVLINTAIAGDAAVHPSKTVQEEMSTPPKNKFALYIRALHLFFPPEWESRMAIALLSDRFHSVYEKGKLTTPQILKEQLHLVRGWSHDNAAAKQIAQLPMPVLILNGGEDIVIPPVNSNILLKTIPHAKLLRWAQGGHSMIYQFPYPIANAISQFIAR